MSEELAFLATCDLVALVRGRALRKDSVLVSEKTVGWVPADISLSAFGSIEEPNPFGSLGDLRLVADPSTEVSLSTIAEVGRPLSVFLANQVLPDGSPWDCDLRTHAQRSIAELKSQYGIDLVASFEHEFVLVDPFTAEGSPFGLDSFRLAEPFGSDLFESLAANGLEPENWLAEYGAGQFEITVRPAPAMVAADRAILLREIVRDVARIHGKRASFSPLPKIDGVGNGVHVHLSLYKDGEPVTYDSTQPGGLSHLASTAFAGILEHAAALQAWTAPSQISSYRLKPHRWSSGGAFAAVQDREALLRICPLVKIGSGDPIQSFNVEYRAADATANPWVVISVLTRALIAGLDAGKPISKIYTLDDPATADSVPTLPNSLEEAISELLNDVTVLSWFSPDLLEAHLGIRRNEARELAELTPSEKCERYFRVY